MANLNKVMLIGRLTRDPESKSLPSGTSLTTFGLAANNRVKNKDTGEWTEEAMFIDCVCFGNRAKAIDNYLSKGSQVFIEGVLKLERWESSDGTKRSKHTVIVNDFQFLDSKGNNNSSNNEEYSAMEDNGDVPF